MKRRTRTALIVGVAYVLLALFGLPLLLHFDPLSPGCPIAPVRAQDNACMGQEATNRFQEALIGQLQSTLSVQEAHIRRLVRTDVARQQLILQLESTLAAVDMASTAMPLVATESTSGTATAAASQTVTPVSEGAIPLAGEWSSTAAGDCVPVPGSTTVAVQGDQLILTTAVASSTYHQIAPGVYLNEQSSETYTVRSTLTVIDPRHIEGEVISISGGETFTCRVQMELRETAE